MHRHEMQQSNIYLGIYIIEYYFFWKNQGVTSGEISVWMFCRLGKSVKNYVVISWPYT
jgi:hypothetical protein